MEARILVIDDEETIRFTFERFLRNAGYEVESSASLEDGIRQLAETNYDMVFADIVLGGDSGVDVLRGMRERNITCPLVFITGYPNFQTASEAVRLGAFDYLAKPVDKEALLSVTERALQRKKTMEENERSRSNLEATFRSVKDVIITVDKGLVVLEFNRAAQNHCGFSRDALGQPFDRFADGCDGRCLEALHRAIETETPQAVPRFECRPQRRARCVMSLTASPLMDRNGTFSGAVLVVRDETGQVHLERDRGECRQFPNIVGRCEKMQRIYALIETLANVQSSVLISGESGTGKELLAEAIHFAGKYKEKPLIKVNCSALSENLLESELFGHVRGAFTGAVKSRVGRFQLAHGGTIFLDEIGDISPGIQQRLLRVLQEGEFERVGDSQPVKVDVRVIAATNKDLRTQIKRGDFREDLYYRLKVVEMTLPPLRERRADIPLLVKHFMRKFNEKLGKHIEAVSEDVQAIFMHHPWPGNVRQLAHTLEHAFILCTQSIVTVDHLPPDFREVADSGEISSLRQDRGRESEAILQALHKTDWNKARAARLLGISRQALYQKIKKNGIALGKPDEP
jgi:two-component system, NtrC family, response regulator HydG